MNFAYQGKQPPAKLAAIASTNMSNAIPASSTSNSTCWVSDTGSIDHFTPDINQLPDYHEYHGNDFVTVGNGQSLPITHTGNSQLRTISHPFHLRKILHVPTMSSNLLLVHRFYKDNNASFYFDASKFHIRDLSLGSLLYKGLSEHGLYPIRGTVHPLPSSCQSNFTQSTTNVSPQIWHSRLGHPNSRVFRHVMHSSLNNIASSSELSFCSHCVQGIMHSLPFSDSVSVTSKPLVHSDVWGLALVTAWNGISYYVSFIDDFTRFTWIYLVKYKSQVLSSFIHFRNTMENLLNTRIKIIRTDCGGEYSKTEFQSLCGSAGI
jgi:hypothetical protein